MDLAHAAANFLRPDTTPPSRFDALWFDLRAVAHRARRMLAEIGRRPPRHRSGDVLADAPVVAEFASPLWPSDESERSLVAGKIHNLRLARQRLHGLEIPAGATFSFWRQLGRAGASRGFVAGRELREGCVVPAIGGGLCQLSNALYNAALATGMEIVERHRHSRALLGSLAELDRDATVFWNYLDLRLRAPHAWRLEVDMDADRLRIRVRAVRAAVTAVPKFLAPRGHAKPTGECASCEHRRCHRWTGKRALHGNRTWLHDPASPLGDAARLEIDTGDRVLQAGSGESSAMRAVHRVAAALRRRIARLCGVTLAAYRLGESARLARALAVRLRPDDLHVVVPQRLLPFLWRDGVLVGRRFDVLMDALPMAWLQQRLDEAAVRHPHATSLRDFRAPAILVADEHDALAAAGLLLGAHAQVLALAGERAKPLAWSRPIPVPRAAKPPSPPQVLYPASSLARKGALELREALRGLPVQLLLPPGGQETVDFWAGYDVIRIESLVAGLTTADVVVLPAWIEHHPRALLAAMAAGVPVMATPACGLAPSPAWTSVPEGDVEALRSALIAAAAEFSRTTCDAPR